MSCGAETDGGDPAEFQFAPEPLRRELNPTWLSAAATLHGAPGLNPSRPLRVLDLHCREGLHAATIAAAHPLAEVVAVDRDIANVDCAQRLADLAGLENMTARGWHECLRDAEEREPDVDLVIADDLISTITSNDRGKVLEVVARRLRIGGMAVFSYRTVSGWSELLPLHSLAVHLSSSGLASDAAPAAVAAVLSELREAGAAFLTRPYVDNAVSEMLVEEAAQLASILLVDQLSPVSPPMLREWLRPIGLRPVGSARLGLDRLDEVQESLLADTIDPALRESYRDMFERAPYRIDIFRRGIADLGAAAQSEIDHLELMRRPGREAEVSSAVASDARPYLDRHDSSYSEANQTFTVRDIRDFNGQDISSIRPVIAALMAHGAVHPRSVGWAGGHLATRAADRLNAVLVRAVPPIANYRCDPDIGSAENLVQRRQNVTL